MRNNAPFPGSLAVHVTLLCFAVCAHDAHAVFFDLRGLTPSGSFNYTLSSGGVTVTVGGSGQLMKSHPLTFGIDSNGSGDDPTLIDGGGGTSESFAFLFGQNVLFESILISHFDSVDSGSFNIKGGITISLANGLNDVDAVAAASSAHFLRWTGDMVAGMGRGFSVDGFSVRLAGTAPNPSGDYNNNGTVDAADYVVWRKNLNSSADLPNDETTGVDVGDYSVWQAHFGQSGAEGSGAMSPVPEPSFTLLLTIGFFALLSTFRCRPVTSAHAIR